MYALKLALVALAAFPLVSNTPTPIAFAQDAAIPKVVCPVPDGYSMGTAFRVGGSLLLTVKHVTAEAPCYIDGRPVKVLYTDPKRDFSMISDGSSGPSLKIDCGGFVKGRKYLAVGHARGRDELTTVELEATGDSNWGFSVLTGVFTVVPGQSGGPVIDAETGAVVGTVNVYEFTEGVSGSVPLRDTPVCHH